MRLYECPKGHKYGIAGYDEDLTNNILRKSTHGDCHICKIENQELKKREQTPHDMSEL